MTNRTATLSPAIITQIANAGIKIIQIEAVASHLAELMAAAHGDDWEVCTSHKAGAEFILIKPKMESGKC